MILQDVKKVIYVFIIFQEIFGQMVSRQLIYSLCCGKRLPSYQASVHSCSFCSHFNTFTVFPVYVFVTKLPIFHTIYASTSRWEWHGLSFAVKFGRPISQVARLTQRACLMHAALLFLEGRWKRNYLAEFVFKFDIHCALFALRQNHVSDPSLPGLDVNVYTYL